jgi:hypothetical protein
MSAGLREDPTRHFFLLANKRSQQALEQRIDILDVYADLFDSAVARARDAQAQLRMLSWASSPWWSSARRRYRRAIRAGRHRQ